jgi:DNA-directed RNA polymerase specialized sigma24 family protein
MSVKTPAGGENGTADPFRGGGGVLTRELQLHCDRILGSVHDAEDVVQETLPAAWRSLEAVEGRASVRSWL